MDCRSDAPRSGESADGKRGGMTDMNTRPKPVFGAGIMLVILMTTFAAFAQDASEEDSMQPAVDTSSAELEAERETVEPAVSSAVLAQDVTRDESGTQVMDSIELGRTEVTGNQELPKVLYIVPWQKSDPGDLMGRPVNTLLDEVLAPIDREEFLRQVDYHDDLYGDAGE
jgi:hypothetical protein